MTRLDMREVSMCLSYVGPQDNEEPTLLLVWPLKMLLFILSDIRYYKQNTF